MVAWEASRQKLDEWIQKAKVEEQRAQDEAKRRLAEEEEQCLAAEQEEVLAQAAAEAAEAPGESQKEQFRGGEGLWKIS